MAVPFQGQLSESGAKLAMRKVNIAAALCALLSLGLIGCNGTSASTSSSSSNSTSNTNAGFYLPGQAPVDYEGLTPGDLADGDLSLFTRVDHLMTNSDFHSETMGQVTVSILGTEGMVQDICSFNISVGNQSLNHAVTTYNSGSLGQYAFDLNSGVIAYADPSQSTYRTIATSGATQDMFDYYDDGWKCIIAEEAWGTSEYETLANLQLFLYDIGRPTWVFSSYYVPDTSAILSSTLVGDDDDTMTFRIVFNTDESQGTNAATYYQYQMTKVTAGVGALDISINSLEMDLVVDRDSFTPISSTITESYEGGLAGMNGLFSISNTMSSRYSILENGLDDVEDSYEKAVFAAAVEIG